MTGTAPGWRTPDPAALERQHAAFVELLDGLGVEVEVADALDGQVDAVYMHDPLIMSGARRHPAQHGQAGPHARARPRRGGARGGSTSPCSARSKATPTPTAATASGSTTRRRAIGLGYRTNRKGAARAAGAAGARGHPRRDLRHAARPGRRRTCCTCSRSCSAATESLFVVFEPLAPVRLLQDIQERGIEYIAIDHDSYLAMGCNILAVRAGVVVMVDGVPAVRRALEAAGVEVHAYDGRDLSLKGDGGPTCLTAPLLRA